MFMTEGSSWGLCGEKTYAISALTRARVNCTALIVGFDQEVEHINEILMSNVGWLKGILQPVKQKNIQDYLNPVLN